MRGRTDSRFGRDVAGRAVPDIRARLPRRRHAETARAFEPRPGRPLGPCPSCPRRGPTSTIIVNQLWCQGPLIIGATGEEILALWERSSGTMARILRDAGLSDLVESAEVECLARGFTFTEGPL